MQYINIPGINNSGEHHWQTRWENLYPNQFIRVHQLHWDNPEKKLWVRTLDNSIRNSSGPFILIAHSLGCITAVHWAREFFTDSVVGALLVAPADVEKTESGKLCCFAPIPLTPLPFPSIIVASNNDPHADIKRVAAWAGAWESDLVEIGNEGHINAASGLGNWLQGLEILEYLKKNTRVRAA